MRCFIAIELPEPIRHRLSGLQEALASLDREVRWTRPEQIHLTLKFLGEVPDREVLGVCEALAGAATLCEPIDLEIGGVGCFPERGAARIIWVGVAGPPPSLTRCHAAIERACADVGFAPEDRAFRPHLTIGRARAARGSHQLRPALTRHEGFSAGRFVAEELVVFQSILQPGGPIHTVLSRSPLAGPAR